MVCDICSREFSARRKPICASCAQAILYEPRIEQAVSLLDREKAHTHAEAVLRPGNDGVLAALPQDADFDAIEHGVKKHSVERQRAEREAIEDRVNAIIEQAALLRQQIDEYKGYKDKQVQLNDRRKHDIAAGHKELAQRRPQVLDPVQSAIRKDSRRLEKVHNRTTEARAYLCQKTAELSGLPQHCAEHGRLNGKYELGGIAIPDLRELNGQHHKVKSISKPMQSFIGRGNEDEETNGMPYHQQISASLDNVCRLLGLWCHYLSIRLPAEVIMPHNDFPHPAIMPEKSSYKSRETPYPNGSSSQSSSPAASKLLDMRNMPRPRLLHLNRSLPKLNKEDPKAYGLFLEGVTLLAWDIAWLCKSQGINTINSFDDVCNVGKNLWQLLEAQRGASLVRPRLDRNISTATDVTARSRQPTPLTPGVRFGIYSHGSAHRSLSGHEGLELFRDWKLPLPARLTDKLKSYLLTEMTGAEWDLMEDKEWEDEREDELAVLIGGERRSIDSKHPAMSVMTVAPHNGADDDDTANGRPKGSSGWMKVRGRNGDV